jgi:flagellar hook-associated protein 2
MGSPITFGGFNNIDFGVVLNAIMQQERAPLNALEAQRKALEAQSSAFSAFATRLGALESAVANLATRDGLAGVSARSSDDTRVGISTSASTVAGTYEVVVTELARAQVLASQTTYSNLTDVVATSGAITLARTLQPPINITITGATTLQDLATAINTHADSPVNASIVQVSPGQYRLVLTGRATGIDNSFTVRFDTPLGGGSGLAFADANNDGVSGDTDSDNVQAASNAAVTVNQLAISSASNTLENVVPGVTLTLLKKDPATTVTVQVEQNHGETTARVQKFVSAYNDLLAFINEQNTAVASGKAGISRDPLVRGLRNALRSIISAAHGQGGIARLPEAGIGFESSGRIRVDERRLREALSASPEDVAQLFAGGNGTDGAFGELKALVTRYTQPGGLVADVRDRLGSHASRLGARMVTLESLLAVRRAALQQEFIAADRAMTQLNTQGSSLGQLGGQYRLF